MPGHGGITHFGIQSSGDTSNPDAWASFTCGHCGRHVTGAVVARVVSGNAEPVVLWLRCPSCHDGSVACASGVVYPAAPFGDPVEGLPDPVSQAYEEARRCMSVSGYTAAELICRKILMHVAADKGAPPSKTFAEYLGCLEQQGYITPPMKPWVDLIREHGNEATHELPATGRQRAEGTVSFTA